MKPLRLTSLVVFGGNGNNSSGFTGLPAGNHYSEGTFKYIERTVTFGLLPRKSDVSHG